MARYTQIHAQARGVSQLGGVINAMRGVAASRAQQSRQQLDIVRIYADIVGQSISQVLSLTPQPAGAERRRGSGSALVVFGAEHGFAGAFSERILDSVSTQVAAEGSHLLLVGSRALRLAQARGWQPRWSAQLVSKLANASLLADRIAAELSRLIHAGSVQRVEVIHARPQSAQGFEIVRQCLLPLDYTRFSNAVAAVPPLLNLPPNVLLERLAGEYLFAQLNEAIVHSYAAENLARLETMTAARDNIRHRMTKLSAEEAQARQSEITAEIIELAAGAAL